MSHIHWRRRLWSSLTQPAGGSHRRIKELTGGPSHPRVLVPSSSVPTRGLRSWEPAARFACGAENTPRARTCGTIFTALHKRSCNQPNPLAQHHRRTDGGVRSICFSFSTKTHNSSHSDTLGNVFSCSKGLLFLTTKGCKRTFTEQSLPDDRRQTRS